MGTWERVLSFLPGNVHRRLHELYHEHGAPLMAATHVDPRLRAAVVERASVVNADLCRRGVRPRSRRFRAAVVDLIDRLVDRITAPGAVLPKAAEPFSWFSLELAALTVLLVHHGHRPPRPGGMEWAGQVPAATFRRSASPPARPPI
ncbi:hypothetical protein [Nocardiopsis ansamitocini]|uniref:Uncharacterized protein n=1 Tax=Nocardiopsis ansamitocini TaxID=1670832 RepID=A0A9W6P7Y4_9ACTN|nr:hypothetical protein [Nocardiopsis ansamitocini]GLU48840.1 hypothetical protein Nans01_31910 [Nocardiopsis ansamitocini]